MIIWVDIELDGRDLFLVKSILNIKGDYGTHRFSVTKENTDIQLKVYKDKSDFGYKALLVAENKVFDIKPTLNPKSLTLLFTKVSQHMGGYNSDNIYIAKKIVALIRSRPEKTLHINYGSQIAMFCNKSSVIKTNFEADYATFIALISNQETVVSEDEGELTHQKFSFSHPLIPTLWNIGLEFNHHLFDANYHNESHDFKLLSWPNFGVLSPKTEFIYLSGMLKKQALTLNELIRFTNYSHATIYGFLNAMILSGHLQINQRNLGKQSQNIAGNSKFIKRLKSLFVRAG